MVVGVTQYDVIVYNMYVHARMLLWAIFRLLFQFLTETVINQNIKADPFLDYA